jgi:Domain of Unknown Function (DUF1080).
VAEMNRFLNASMVLVLAGAASLSAQEKKEFPKPEKMTPGMTEYWEPQPAVVTPGTCCTAPSDAIVLFDGKDLSKWCASDGSEALWKVKNGAVTVVKTGKGAGDIRTKDEFGSFQLHLEWCTPEGITGESQARGNSGVFLQGIYEIQILDCYRNESYANGMVGSVYKQTAPLVNPMRKPGEWNVYDIIYTAPVFKADGTYLYEPRVTVLLNGVLVQNNTAIHGTTEYIGLPQVREHGAGPIILQSHGDPSAPISFRNIWIRNL